MTQTDDSTVDRRRFPRVVAPILCRSARLRTARRPVLDVGLGGARVYSDERFEPGERLDVELFLGDGHELVCLMRVAWIKTLPAGSPARYDVGLQLLDLQGSDALARLGRVLADEPSA